MNLRPPSTIEGVLPLHYKPLELGEWHINGGGETKTENRKSIAASATRKLPCAKRSIKPIVSIVVLFCVLLFDQHP